MMVEPTPEQQRLVQQAKDYQRQRMESTGEVIATSEVCLVSAVAYIIACIHLLCTLIMPSWAEYMVIVMCVFAESCPQLVLHNC